MLNRFLYSIAAVMLLWSAPAFAAQVSPDKDFVLTIPDGWQTLSRNVAGLLDPAVKRMFDCVDDNPNELKLVGWKNDDSGAPQGAFCISYRKAGMAKVMRLLKASTGKERDEAAGKFIDAFAGDIHAGYARREMRVVDMSGDLMTAGNDLIMVLDGKIRGAGREMMRSTTVILHGDALVNIGVVHGVGAPRSIVEQLDMLPLSITWKK